MNPDQVVIAEILRSRGNRGEVLALSLTDVPGRLENLKSGVVRFANGKDEPVQVESSWVHGENWVFKFAGVDSITEAERFKGSALWVPFAERGSLPEGEFFRTDLLGCTVWDEPTGREIGSVQGFQQYGGPLLLEVIWQGREVLIPFVPQICHRVDVQGKRIDANLPEGLLDL